ncbi:hypothetical protein [Calycomorphotria hydatis]|uniref:Uncharacterized protein n=1 Tax=Calycomorphotria hydatis TaxID=2528027 RepID=A0A517T768_9PLAN|nr:hypothetical protein [Calycomorphotria hydatis]QDT64209.1 hypothetical protein V22_14400 [Calycomorphotria hydatis]
MRKMILVLLLAACLCEVGCIMPIYAALRDQRTRQLIYVSENLRQVTEIWERIWFLNIPDTATPYRVHGGII